MRHKDATYKCNLAGFFILPESYSNGRIEVLSLPAGSVEFARSLLRAEFGGSEGKVNTGEQPYSYASGD
jgi:hypothetical protein